MDSKYHIQPIKCTLLITVSNTLENIEDPDHSASFGSKLIWDKKFPLVPTIYEPAHKILVLIAYAQMSLINTYGDVTRAVRGINFGLSLHLLPINTLCK